MTRTLALSIFSILLTTQVAISVPVPAPGEPDETPGVYTGYLRAIEISFCMDSCSNYYLESEGGDYITNVTDFDELETLAYFTDRFVTLSGDEVWCVECGAVDVDEIALSDACSWPVSCFANPCLVSGSACAMYYPDDCVASYCGGCHADFYPDGELTTSCDPPPACDTLGDCAQCTDAGCFWQPAGDGLCLDSCMIADMSCYGSTEDWTAACPESVTTSCTDLSGVDFGPCDMYLGVGYAKGECQSFSGCGWNVGGVNYSDAFFDSVASCEAACGGGTALSCDEIPDAYDALHMDSEYTTCEVDNDCTAVWGDCGVGLGGCHYSVNAENYPENQVNDLVDQWLNGDCMSWVCDCMAPPYAQCIDGTCTSAYCMGDNPAGCFQTGCDAGYTCVNTGECTPSTCFCSDGFFGEWTCTEDCGGGSCVLMGDLTGDDLVNVNDVVKMVQLVLEAEYASSADMDGNDSLNVLDVVALVGLILAG